ncbi:MAG: hypothetical protein JWN30_1962 [Bacilli bacterium]|nr:hypothetical protein [Bacilli bacterium]
MLLLNMRNRWNKGIVFGCSTTALVCSLFIQAPATARAAASSSDGVSFDAPAGILVDASSGQILWAKNENDQRSPASTTKLMTLYLAEQAIQSGKFKKTDIVPVTPEAYQLTAQGDSSSGWLDPKEKIDLDTMLKLICVPSGNDAAEAVAQFLAGDDIQFVKEMNDAAAKMGLTNTHYLDAHGLTDDPAHHTSAKDLAILARDLITTFPDILTYTSMQSVEIQDDFRKSQNLKPFQNTNELLGKYPGMDGLKTGFTDQAGYCLVATAKRDNMRLISVELGAATNSLRQSESTKLLDYGFANYQEQKVVSAGEIADKTAAVDKGAAVAIPVVAAHDVSVALQKGSAAPTKNDVFVPVTAPVKAGQKVGELQVMQNGQVIAYTDLLAQKADDKASWISLFFRSVFGGIASLFHKL